MAAPSDNIGLLFTHGELFSRAKREYHEFLALLERPKEGEEEERAAMLQRALKEVLGIDVESAEEIVIDGLAFFTKGGYQPLTLFARDICPHCPEIVFSHPITHIRELGKFLLGGHRAYHDCQQEEFERQLAEEMQQASGNGTGRVIRFDEHSESYAIMVRCGTSWVQHGPRYSSLTELREKRSVEICGEGKDHRGLFWEFIYR